MADDVEAKVVTAPAAAATASAASVTDYARFVAVAPVMVVGALTAREPHVMRARALWLVLAGLRPQARLETVLIGDLATFATSGRSKDPGFKQLDDDPPGFYAWTNSGREVLVSPRLFAFADDYTDISTAFVDAVALRLLAHEAKHVEQFRKEGRPPASYKRMGDFEVDAYTATRSQIAKVQASTADEQTLLADWDGAFAAIITTCAKARDAETEPDALDVFKYPDHPLTAMLPLAAGQPPSTLYVPTP